MQQDESEFKMSLGQQHDSSVVELISLKQNSQPAELIMKILARRWRTELENATLLIASKVHISLFA